MANQIEWNASTKEKAREDMRILCEFNRCIRTMCHCTQCGFNFALQKKKETIQNTNQAKWVWFVFFFSGGMFERISNFGMRNCCQLLIICWSFFRTHNASFTTRDGTLAYWSYVGASIWTSVMSTWSNRDCCAEMCSATHYLSRW